LTINEANIAIVGATGLVGGKTLEVLAERGHYPEKLSLFASERSAGKRIAFNSREFIVEPLSSAEGKRFDIAIFAAGSAVSREWAPRFAKAGAVVIDKSSAWRDDPECPLVVPQVNEAALDSIPKGIVASPNCSTSGLVIALKPLFDSFGKPRFIFVATYQSVSGAGRGGNEALSRQRAGEDFCGIFPRPIHDNLIPVIGKIDGDGFNEEETKLCSETRKILGMSDLQLTATAVRVPVMVSHSEAVTIVFEDEVTAEKAERALESAPGLRLYRLPDFPTPLEAAGIDDVLVGRIRNTRGDARILSMFISFDNLRRGAATNAVDLMECIARRLF